MKLVLIGYMASGKSTIGKLLAEELGYTFIDLDHYLEEKESQTISEIFEEGGELKFRKLERFYLEELLDLNEDLVLSLGGGTPCYYDSIDYINKDANNVSIYLKTPLKDLITRLESEKSKRPIVANLDLEALTEFVGKHLFERSYYYNKANLVIENKMIEDTISKIKAYLN